MTNERPNILLVVADCARSDRWLGAGRSSVTPHVDALARQGVSFPTTITEKSCTTPSFATLLTGLYSPRHGVHLVWGYRLADAVPMLTDALADLGYHTYAEVSGPLLAEMGLARGFETYTYRAPCDYLHTGWGEQFLERLRTGYYRSPWFLLLHLWELHPDRQVDPAHDRPECGRDAYDRAVSSLDAQLGRVFAAAGDRTCIIFTGDHGQKTASETYRPGTAVDYARRLLKLDDAGGMVHASVAGWAGPSVLQQFYGRCAPLMASVSLRSGSQSSGRRRWSRLRDRLQLLRLTPMLYLHDLFKLTAPVKLTQVMQRRGLLDEKRARAKIDRLSRAMGPDRLLEMHMRMWTNSYKRNLDEGHMVHVYDFLVRVPLIMRWTARLPAGDVHARMVRQPDILVTVLDLLGANGDRSGDLDGRSLRPLIDGEPWQPVPAYLSVTGLPKDLELRGVRTETHKYTYGPHNAELPAELYDLRADPGETHNLAAARPDDCAALRSSAESLLPAGDEVAAQVMPLTPDDQQRVEDHLRKLGYIE